MNTRVLVMAKAPYPGLVKTRLGAAIGMRAAAELAALALLDTLTAATQAFGPGRLALAGELNDAVRGEELRSALTGWTVVSQRGAGLADRLARAHLDLAASSAGAVVQIGMDTPQVTPDLLQRAAASLRGGSDAVLGPAADGGWWLLGLAEPGHGAGLAEVEMSASDTGAATARMLRKRIRGGLITELDTLVDVDTITDAHLVAAQAPHTRFARGWRELVGTPA